MSVMSGKMGELVEQTLADRILEEVSRSPGLEFEELVRACPGFTWRHIFHHVARMSRSRQLVLAMIDRERFAVWLPASSTKSERRFLTAQLSAPLKVLPLQRGWD